MVLMQIMDITPAIKMLCLECGLCCDGVIFADIELHQRAEIRSANSLGLQLQRKGLRRCLPQPCPAYDGKNCQIYSARPTRCREFECRQLQLLELGKLTPSQAKANIRRARRLAAEVEDLLRKFVPKDESLPLTKRYANFMLQPIDFSQGRKAESERVQVMRKTESLRRILNRDFLNPA
jgi:uncharacterized protein